MLQQKINHAGVAKLARPGKAILHLLLRGAGLQAPVRVEEGSDRIEPSDAGCSFEIQSRAVGGKKRCSSATPVRQAANDGSAPFSSPFRVIDGGSVVEQKLKESFLNSSSLRMATGGSQAERGGSAAIDIRLGINLGSGLEQRLRDLNSVLRRFLPVTFNPIGGD